MSRKKSYEQYMKLVVYLVVVVLINLVGMTLFFRLDLTKNQIYSISDASRRVVSTLTEPLTIHVFFTKNLPAPYNSTERYLRDLLEEYANNSNKFFSYKFYNVSSDDEGINLSLKKNEEIAESYGIYPIQVETVEKDQVAFKKAYMGLAMTHGDMIEKLPQVTEMNGLEYSLTTAIQRLNNKISAMLSLKENIKITFFMSEALKKVAPMMGLDILKDYPDKIKDVIDQANSKNYGKLEYVYIDPSDPTHKDANFNEKYKLTQLSWPALASGQIQEGNGSIGLIVEYMGKNVEIPVLRVLRIPIIGTQYQLTEIAQLDELLNESIETLVDINEDIGYLADHGTLSTAGGGASPFGQQMPDSLGNFAALVSRNYNIKDISLKDDIIGPSMKSLIIVRPTEPFSDYELFQIDQALMRGTNLALFLDRFKESQAPGQNMGFNQGPNYTPLDTGLEKLLDHYGIRMKESLVLDENCHKQRMPGHMGGGERPIYFAPIIQSSNINRNLEYLSSIKGLVGVKLSPLEIDEQKLKDNKINAHKIISSSDKSWEMKDNINLNPIFLQPPTDKEEMKSYPLAYMLEGEFKSYFDGKPVPEKPAEEKKDKNEEEEKESGKTEETSPELQKIEGKSALISKGKPGKIFLMASADMLKDNLLSEDGQRPNDMFIMNIIDSLNGRDDIATMRSKVQDFNPLALTSAFLKIFVKFFNVVGLPILVIFVGLGVWLRRHTKKKMIQLMFQS